MTKDKPSQDDLFLRGARLRARQKVDQRDLHGETSRAGAEDFFQALVGEPGRMSRHTAPLQEAGTMRGWLNGRAAPHSAVGLCREVSKAGIFRWRGVALQNQRAEFSLSVPRPMGAPIAETRSPFPIPVRRCRGAGAHLPVARQWHQTARRPFENRRVTGPET